MTAREIQFHLDFVSPYSWLALLRAEEFGGRHGVRWDLRPVVYAALLDAHRLVGPVETEAKRRYTFEDVARCARRRGPRWWRRRRIRTARWKHCARYSCSASSPKR